MTYFRIFVLLWLLCSALSSGAVEKAAAQPIISGRIIPPNIVRLAPSEARSLFWGTVTPSNSHTALGVRFLQLKPQKFEGEQTHSFCVQIFSMPSFGKSQVVQDYRFLCTSTFGLQGKRVSAELLWLNKARRIPILKFSVLSHGDYGLYGDEISLTFAQGWHYPPVVQNWASGSWFFSDSIGQTNDWKHRDARGNLEVISVVNIPAPDNPQRVEWWRWQKSKFVRAKMQTLYSPVNVSRISP